MLQVGGSHQRSNGENRIKAVLARGDEKRNREREREREREGERERDRVASRKAQSRVGHVVSKVSSSLLNINVYVRAGTIKRLLW